MDSSPVANVERFPFRLGEPLPKERPLRPAKAILAVLFAVCLVPRAFMASKIDVLCRDGVFYAALASRYEAGDLEGGLGSLRLNTYPPILASLHSAGLSWENAGRWWGTLVASAVVLPLFGWIRRQFDDQTAKVACVLYAVHPRFIIWSPEVVRDQTFWLLMACSLYAGWRASRETAWGWFAAAGLSLTLAMHTRFEGWFLWMTLIGWTGCRWLARPEMRKRLAIGLAMAVAICPASLAAVNLTLLRELPRWELGNFVRLTYVTRWIESWNNQTPQAPSVSPDSLVPRAAVAAAATSIEAAPRMSPAMLTWHFINTLRRGLGDIFAIAMLWGIWRFRAVWGRRDHQPAFWAALAIAVGTFIHLWYAQESSSRYALGIAILGAPFAALGCLAIARDWADRFARVHLGETTRLRVLATMVLLTMVQGWSQAFASDIPDRQREAAVGRWVRERLRPGERLAAPSSCSLLAHYGEATLEPLPSSSDAEGEPTALRLIACPRKRAYAQTCESLRRVAVGLHLREVPAEELPAEWRGDWLVFERRVRR